MNQMTSPIVVLITLALAACSTGRAADQVADHATDTVSAASMDHGAHAGSVVGALEGSGPWTVTATDGSHVTLSTAEAPLEAGPVELRLAVHAAGGATEAVSADLVSPTMPMHGVQRFAVHDGVVVLEIPMEGDWTIYVNIDSVGSNTAEFAFAVSPGSTPAHAHHSGGNQ